MEALHGFPPAAGVWGAATGVAGVVPRRWERKMLLMLPMDAIRLKAEPARWTEDRDRWREGREVVNAALHRFCRSVAEWSELWGFWSHLRLMLEPEPELEQGSGLEQGLGSESGLQQVLPGSDRTCSTGTGTLSCWESGWGWAWAWGCSPSLFQYVRCQIYISKNYI